MGFDQYHEPPEELPPATRTFARLCASLTEEAEAIGWFAQRIGIGGDPPCEGVTGLQRRVLPLVEVRAEFTLSRSELRDDDRGASDADLEPLDLAAHQMAVAENKAVFHGWAAASITGIAEASHHQGLNLGEVADSFRRPVASAVEQLLQGGIAGPYALALGSDEYK